MLFMLLVTLCSCLYIFYFICNRKFNYWQKKNVKFVTPAPFVGNYGGYILLKKCIFEVVSDLCKLFPNEPYFGAFFGTEPTLIIQDPQLIKLVMTKDFYFFSGREGSKYTHNETITQNVFFTYGNRWKVIRQNLTPLFSSAKMKNMFHIIERCTGVFETLLAQESLAPEVNIRSLMSRFTMDCIVGCAFGIDPNTMKECENNQFRIIGDLSFDTSLSQGVKNVVKSAWPGVFYGLGFKAFPTNLTNFFSELLVGIFEARDYKPTERNDFIDLMLNLKKNKYITGYGFTKTGDQSENNKIELEADEDLLVSHCFAFFAAGFETSASSLSLTLFELAKNSEVQQQAQREVDDYVNIHGSKLTYDCVKDLPYIEACIEETLRIYPILGVLTREVMDQYTFPTGLTVNKGDRVHIPVYQLHRDPNHFPEPELYKPERFYGEAKKDIKPYTYMPFGDGPRICIGMRFAKMLMLPALVTILKDYTVTLAEGMPEKINFEPKAIVTQPNSPIRLKLLSRNKLQSH